MSRFWDRIGHLADQIISVSPKTTIDDDNKVEIICRCGSKNIISTRSLVRKWEDKDQYLCKSCHVKSYINKSDRIEKFKRSFSITANTDEHKRKCSEAAQKLWNDPEKRAYISHLVSIDNKNNPKKIMARKKALEVFMNKKWFRNHMTTIRTKQSDQPSILELVIKQVLDEMDINYISQYRLGYYLYDFFLTDYNILLEVQGEYWHHNTTVKDSAKATYASNQGYVIKHIWEHEFGQHGKIKKIISNIIGIDRHPIINYNFEDLEIAEIDTKQARVFYGMHHYLPSISKFGIHYGAFLDDELIAAITFSKPIRLESAKRIGLKTNELKELSRFCIHPSYQQKNLASWFISRTIKFLKTKDEYIKCLISFADTTMGHTGTIYKASNWMFDGETKPSYHWVTSDGYLAHKKTIWDRAKKMGMKEFEYARENEYSKIPSKPKRRYLYWLR